MHLGRLAEECLEVLLILDLPCEGFGGVAGQPADDFVDFFLPSALLLRLRQVVGIDTRECHPEDSLQVHGFLRGGLRFPVARTRSTSESSEGASSSSLISTLLSVEINGRIEEMRSRVGVWRPECTPEEIVVLDGTLNGIVVGVTAAGVIRERRDPIGD